MPLELPAPLTPEILRRRFDPDQVPFETSDTAAQCLESVLGQSRAKEALEFGLDMCDMDYHVFVAGPQRTGKTHLVRTFLEKVAAKGQAPDDWVYVHNFHQPDEPLSLRLPPGQGKELAREMDKLLETLLAKIPELFESEDYARGKEAMAAQFKHRRSEIFEVLDGQAREQGYVLKFEPTGIMVAPAGEDGEPLPEAALREMSDEQREELRQKSDIIQAKVTESLRAVSALEKELNGTLEENDHKLVLGVVGSLLGDLSQKYAGLKRVLAYLEQVKQDVVEHYERFQKKEAPQLPFPMPVDKPDFKEYKVNVLVDNSDTQGAPVIVESNPTFPNLFGRIERQAQFGALVTDFTLLKAGALHKANGGYLVLPMLELLRLWLPWEGLKRALKEREVLMEDAMEQLGYMITRSLKPQPIPLDLKVVLVGETQLYHLLYTYDHQFPKLFKVRAQMSEHMDWGEQEVQDFISHLCNLGRKHELLPLHRSAVARLIERGAELAGDRERLTLRLSDLEDLVKESNFIAKKNGGKAIGGDDVAQAVTQRQRRSSMIEERMREAITRGFINVSSDGEQVGEVNGLAVYDLGDYAFGKASRISASVGLGKAGVTTVDREAELSGPFHNKGVLIIGGFLRNRFAQKGPLTLTASLVFEQSYGTIDGDSASLAEVLALMSQLSGLPLRQDLAITGSMDQKGRAQAIGGVNLKIEGFFRLCEERGLTGSQGVVIPTANLKNLMLHPDIVAAAEQGKFTVRAVDSVDQAMEIFMGKPAGVRNKQGNFPRGSINYLAEKELEEFRKAAKAMTGKGSKK